eukprot:2345522-Lingulodinium_polyedra.AAC.1
MLGSAAALSVAGSTAPCSSGTGSPRGRSPQARERTAASPGAVGPGRLLAAATRHLDAAGGAAPGRCHSDPLGQGSGP